MVEMLFSARSLPLFAAALLAVAPIVAPIAAASAVTAALSLRPAVVSLAAAPSTSWSVKPADDAKGSRSAFSYATDPGSQVNDFVIVTNSGTAAADFAIYAADAINDPVTGSLSLVAKSTKSSDLGGWVTMNLATLHLEPGNQAKIPFTMLVPSDASPGDHSAGIVAASTTAGTGKGQTVLVEQRVGVRINLRVSGPVAPRIETAGLVTSFTPSANPFAPGAIAVDYSVANRGNIRLDVNQKLDVVGPFGIQLGILVPPVVHNLLPGQSAHIVAKLDGVAALALAWSTVTLSPAPVGNVPDHTTDPNQAPAAEVKRDPNADATFAPVSSTTQTVAISWSLLAIFALLGAVVFLVHRYIRNTRFQFYAAVDQAAADAREAALRDVELSGRVAAR